MTEHDEHTRHELRSVRVSGDEHLLLTVPPDIWFDRWECENCGGVHTAVRVGLTVGALDPERAEDGVEKQVNLVLSDHEAFLFGAQLQAAAHQAPFMASDGNDDNDDDG